MTRQNLQKLKLLLSQNPQNMVFTSKWLNDHGINNKLTWWYTRSGWLEHIGPKVYKRVNAPLSWEIAVASIQTQLKIELFVGGKTALQLLGKAHYIPLDGIKTVELFTLPATLVPNWLTETNSFEVKFYFHKAALFTPQVHSEVGLTKQEINNIQLLMSAPERAMMEVFQDVPKRVSYEESLQLMENLVFLRPQVVQKLLVDCQSVKVKRLFLHAAEKCQHKWLNDLTIKSINLGKGKRKIGTGGHYDPKYQLSVPQLKHGEDDE